MERFNFYWLSDSCTSINFDLQNLWLSFDRTNDWMRVDIDEGVVRIWNSWDMKYQKDKNFISSEEKKKYDDAYAQYWFKRREEMPILEITEQNYQEVLQQWYDAREKKLAYMIISIDNFGWVSIEVKDKLSHKDQQDMQQEHQKFLEYRKKWDAYAPFTYKQNKEWQSPADEEYYSDFLTEAEMVWKKKKF